MLRSSSFFSVLTRLSANITLFAHSCQPKAISLMLSAALALPFFCLASMPIESHLGNDMWVRNANTRLLLSAPDEWAIFYSHNHSRQYWKIPTEINRGIEILFVCNQHWWRGVCILHVSRCVRMPIHITYSRSILLGNGWVVDRVPVLRLSDKHVVFESANALPFIPRTTMVVWSGSTRSSVSYALYSLCAYEQT